MYTYGDSVAKPCPTLATLVACQAPLSMEFPREGYWNGLPFPSPRYPPDPGIEPWAMGVKMPNSNHWTAWEFPALHLRCGS